MKLVKSLTLVCILALIGGCKKQQSATFSSSEPSITTSATTSEPTSEITSAPTSESANLPSSEVTSESSLVPSSESSDSNKESSSEEPSSSSISSSSEESSVPIEHHYADEWSSDSENHWKQCIDEGFEDLYSEKASHSFQATSVVEPTYESTGYTEYTCSVCQYSYQDNFEPALEHNFADEWSKDDEHHWKVCLDEGYEDLKHDYSAHTLVLTDDAADVYASEGYYPYICKKCGYETTSTTLLVYGNYYDSLVSWTDGEDLKNQLNAIIRDGYQPLSYTKSSKQNYDTNIHADHAKDDFENLNVIYSNQNTFKTDTNKGWQREHAWCASLMCGTTTGPAINYRGRATDFHNLFAANASGNQSRGNKNYGVADHSSSTYKTDFLVNGGEDGYSYDNVVFEPGDVDKGRLARAIFYMATMYKDAEYDTANKVMMQGLKIVEDNVPYIQGNDCHFAIGHLSDLLAWNENTPVDYLEMQHNVSVYTDSDNLEGYAQGNRNPYVDYPELVDYVYGSKKDQPGTLASLTPSANYLNCENDDISHYAIKEAKRDFGYSETLSANDYKIVEVYNNFTFSETTQAVSNSFDGHSFSESDGNYVNAVISTPLNQITYRIVLNPMGMCNSGVLPLTTTGINKKTKDVDQNVTFGGVPFTFNFSTSYSEVDSKGMRIDNIGAGGITVGSDPKPLTKLTITTKNSYTLDSVYIKAMCGNAGSYYSLSIKVGDKVISTYGVVNSSNWKVFGGVLDEPVTGQISFVFTGSASLKLNSIAFNTINV